MLERRHVALLACLLATACARETETRVRLSSDEAAKLAALQDRRAEVAFVDARGERLHVVDILHDHVDGGATVVLRNEEHAPEATWAGLVLFGAGGGLAVCSGMAALFTGIPVVMSPTDVDMSRYWRAEGTYALAGLGSMAVGALVLLASLPFYRTKPGPSEVRVVSGP